MTSQWVDPTGEKVTRSELETALLRAEHSLVMVRASLASTAYEPRFGDDLVRNLALALSDCGDAIVAIRRAGSGGK